MSPAAAVADFGFIFEYLYLPRAGLLHHSALYLLAFHIRLAYQCLLVVRGVQQDFVKNNFCAGIAEKLLYEDFVVRGNQVLFSAGFNDCERHFFLISLS